MLSGRGSRAGRESLKSRPGCRVTSTAGLLDSDPPPLAGSLALVWPPFVPTPSPPRPPRLRRRRPPRRERPSLSGRAALSGAPVAAVPWGAVATCSVGFAGWSRRGFCSPRADSFSLRVGLGRRSPSRPLLRSRLRSRPRWVLRSRSRPPRPCSSRPLRSGRDPDLADSWAFGATGFGSPNSRVLSEPNRPRRGALAGAVTGAGTGSGGAGAGAVGMMVVTAAGGAGGRLTCRASSAVSAGVGIL